jgi:hypothetical protein
MNKHVLEFLNSIEDIHPLGAHVKFYDTWAEDVRFFAADAGVIETEDDTRTLEMGLTIRSMSHQAAVAGFSVTGSDFAEADSDDSWRWLLTTKQVEQRTPEWYMETKNILTASEIATVFKGGRTRGSMVVAKATPPSDTQRFSSSLAVERRSTGPMDWGVRYEPVVKEHLQKTLGCDIHDLGRIRHRTDPRIAASPDGLFVSCEKDKSLIGRLIEIKCPSTRIIKDGVIPFEYWCQMQLQMEVCGVNACEFVEAKFREKELEGVCSDASASAAIDSGIITLLANVETGENKYEYGTVVEDPLWATVESYGWDLIKLRRITVLRDVNWFAQSQPAFEEFWRDVAAAKAGTYVLPPGRQKKAATATCTEDVIVPETVCKIVDDSA